MLYYRRLLLEIREVKNENRNSGTPKRRKKYYV